MRRGYWYVIVSSLIIAVVSTFRAEYVALAESGAFPSQNFWYKVLVMLVCVLIPGLFAARWYYKMVDQ